MGWTDNGKIMRPWITLSEQGERQIEEQKRGIRVKREGLSRKVLFREFLSSGQAGDERSNWSDVEPQTGLDWYNDFGH